MKRSDGAISAATRQKLARHAFNLTAMYDMRISSHLTSSLLDIGESRSHGIGMGGGGASFSKVFAQRTAAQMKSLVERGLLMLRKRNDLRYGENPHQHAALYDVGWGGGVANATLLNGK